jgi:hypothetical protein
MVNHQIRHGIYFTFFDLFQQKSPINQNYINFLPLNRLAGQLLDVSLLLKENESQ